MEQGPHSFPEPVRNGWQDQRGGPSEKERQGGVVSVSVLISLSIFKGILSVTRRLPTRLHLLKVSTLFSSAKQGIGPQGIFGSKL